MKHDGPNDLLTDETGALKPDLVETLDKIDSKLKELSGPHRYSPKLTVPTAHWNSPQYWIGSLIFPRC